MANAVRRLLSGNPYLRSLGNVAKGRMPLFLDYAVDFTPRWTDETGNPHLRRIIENAAPAYARNLDAIAALAPMVRDWQGGTAPVDWRNRFIPALDGLSLVWAAQRAQALYLEIGSGNSTRFVRGGLRAAGKQTRIVSIDPQPRADIDALCDEVIRQPLETVDPAVFDRLEAGDTLFVDNSHRAFMNSDVTVVMLDVLPRLKAGVLVGIHDIMLPWDYPASWSDRGYNEQYMLACLLLGGQFFDIQLANYWIGREGLDRAPLAAIYETLGADIAARASSAFWAIRR